MFSSGQTETRAAVGYICSEYPAVSHTFVMREVQGLRHHAQPVVTFTVRRSGSEQLLSAEDRAEDASTIAILPVRPWALVSALARLVTTSGGRRGLTAAVRLAASTCRPGVRGVVWELAYLVEAIAVWHESRRRGIKHLHAHFSNVASDVAMLAARIGRETDQDHPWTWSFTLHGPADLWDVQRGALSAKATQADLVVCISDFARAQLMGQTEPTSWPKFEVVHCGVAPDRYRNERRCADPAAPLTIITVGRLAPVKGQRLLIEAVAALKQTGHAVELDIVGTGPERSRLEALTTHLEIEDIVRLEGAASQQRVADMLAQADVMALASFAEGVPVVLMEAMASGLPVVATRVAGIPELVEDGATGRLVTPARVPELVDALRELIEDAELRRSMGAVGREVVLEHFDATREAGKLSAHFSRLLDWGLKPRREPPPMDV